MNQITRYQAHSNQDLIEYLQRKEIIKSPVVFKTMCSVDRKHYVNSYNPYNDAYIDAPQNIGNNRTISAPHMHAVVLENLIDKLVDGKNVLIIRASAGYLSTCMALILGPKGCVVDIDYIQEIQDQKKKNIETNYSDLLTSNRIQIFVGYEPFGYELKAPYDVIYVGAAVEKIPPQILQQLAIGGRLIIPVEAPGGVQTLMQIDKDIDEKITKKSLITVKYGLLNTSQECFLKINRDLSNIRQMLRLNGTIPEKQLNFTNDEASITKIREKPQQFNENIRDMCVTEKPLAQTNLIKTATVKSNDTLPKTNLIKTTIVKSNETLPQSNLFKTTIVKSNETTRVTHDPIVTRFNCQFVKYDRPIKYAIKKNPQQLNENIKNICETEKPPAQSKLCISSNVKSTQSTQTTLESIDTRFDFQINKHVSKIKCPEEHRITKLENETHELRKLLEQQITEQKSLIFQLDKESKLKTTKWDEIVEDKANILENDMKLSERKLNKKLLKLKRTLSEKISKESDDNNKYLICQLENMISVIAIELKTLEAKFEERLTNERIYIRKQIAEELEEKNREQFQFIKNKIMHFENEISINKKLEKEDSKRWIKLKPLANCKNIIFCVLCLHTVSVASKLIFTEINT